jgi:hypothetical protein
MTTITSHATVTTVAPTIKSDRTHPRIAGEEAATSASQTTATSVAATAKDARTKSWFTAAALGLFRPRVQKIACLLNSALR